MNDAGRVIYDALGRPEIARIVKAKRILHNWEAIVGPDLALRSFPDRYDRGTVWVAVEGSAWGQEMRLRKPLFLERLRAAARDDTLFHDLRFGVRRWKARPPKEAPIEAPEEPETNPYRGLSIREIAQNRLNRWPR